MRDLARGHAHDRAKGQGNLCIARQRGMAAREDQTKPVIRIRSDVRRPAVGQQLELGPVGRVATQPVDGATPCCLEEPRSGPLRHALQWPALQGNDHGVLDQVLREVEVTGDPHQRSADEAHLRAEDGVHRLAGRVVQHRVVNPCRTQPAGWLGMSS